MVLLVSSGDVSRNHCTGWHAISCKEEGMASGFPKLISAMHALPRLLRGERGSKMRAFPIGRIMFKIYCTLLNLAFRINTFILDGSYAFISYSIKPHSWCPLTF